LHGDVFGRNSAPRILSLPQFTLGDCEKRVENSHLVQAKFDGLRSAHAIRDEPGSVPPAEVKRQWPGTFASSDALVVPSGSMTEKSA
jgi:hypothetical protein